MIRRPPRSTLFPYTTLLPIFQNAAPYYFNLEVSRAAVDAAVHCADLGDLEVEVVDRKSTRLNSSHGYISYAVFCLKKKKTSDGPAISPHPLELHPNRIYSN